jgi:hypothetical protein
VLAVSLAESKMPALACAKIKIIAISRSIPGRGTFRPRPAVL